MRIFIDDKMERILSVGEDKKFRITDIKTREAQSILKSFDKGLTDLSFSSNLQLAIVSDAGNSLYMIDLTATPPSQTQRIKLECAGPIRGLDVDWNKGIIFSASISDGAIIILKSSDIGDPNIKPE